MREYLDDGLLYKFVCDCGYEWHGVDAGDAPCVKCGGYGKATNTWESAYSKTKNGE